MGDKEESAEGKKQTPQGNEEKKFKSKAFPLGTGEGKDGPQKIASPSEGVPSGGEREPNDSAETLKENQRNPSEKKEEMMDEETAQKLGELKTAITEGTKQTTGAMGKLAEAIEKNRSEPGPESAGASDEGKGKGATGLTKEDVRRIVTEYDESKEERRERDREAREGELKVKAFDKRITDVERKQGEFNKYKEKCEKDGDPIACGRVDVLKKEVDEARKSLSAEEKVELEALEKITNEKRDAMTEEQSKARDASVEPILNRFNISDNDLARKILKDKVNVDNLVKKPILREAVLETFSPEERVKVVEGACKDDVCLVKFREGGYSMLKQDKDGKWKPVDKEVAKQMTPLF